MKKYIRAVLDDLQAGRKDYVPPAPKPVQSEKLIDLDVPPPSPLPDDLDNQDLSGDPEQEVRQLDWQQQQKVQDPGH
jgi:hypothetical protein